MPPNLAPQSWKPGWPGGRARVAAPRRADKDLTGPDPTITMKAAPPRGRQVSTLAGQPKQAGPPCLTYISPPLEKSVAEGLLVEEVQDLHDEGGPFDDEVPELHEEASSFSQLQAIREADCEECELGASGGIEANCDELESGVYGMEESEPRMRRGSGRLVWKAGSEEPQVVVTTMQSDVDVPLPAPRSERPHASYPVAGMGAAYCSSNGTTAPPPPGPGVVAMGKRTSTPPTEPSSAAVLPEAEPGRLRQEAKEKRAGSPIQSKRQQRSPSPPLGGKKLPGAVAAPPALAESRRRTADKEARFRPAGQLGAQRPIVSRQDGRILPKKTLEQHVLEEQQCRSRLERELRAKDEEIRRLTLLLQEREAEDVSSATANNLASVSASASSGSGASGVQLAGATPSCSSRQHQQQRQASCAAAWPMPVVGQESAAGESRRASASLPDEGDGEELHATSCVEPVTLAQAITTAVAAVPSIPTARSSPGGSTHRLAYTPAPAHRSISTSPPPSRSLSRDAGWRGCYDPVLSLPGSAVALPGAPVTPLVSGSRSLPSSRVSSPAPGLTASDASPPQGSRRTLPALQSPAYYAVTAAGVPQAASPGVVARRFFSPARSSQQRSISPTGLGPVVATAVAWTYSPARRRQSPLHPWRPQSPLLAARAAHAQAIQSPALAAAPSPWTTASGMPVPRATLRQETPAAAAQASPQPRYRSLGTVQALQPSRSAAVLPATAQGFVLPSAQCVPASSSFNLVGRR
eukprot:TRINITY_DN17325_c0_g1_i1.p1 TRINITY_DN17325_c0_g1~~TRINITY_DN17325_c0_g1_i1.p1  ORF type:complete len:757 (-),score=126.51 TRINITY_DN17325_c0_g1_i1:76-2325(-)